MSQADSRKRVLCVDDSRLTREQVRDALGDRFALECVDSAEAALERSHAAAARELDKDRKQVHRWIRRFGIDLGRFRAP